MLVKQLESSIPPVLTTSMHGVILPALLCGAVKTYFPMELKLNTFNWHLPIPFPYSPSFKEALCHSQLL